nr:uridine diphosphate glucose pyrophosphatase NUDT22 isoform X3 [Mirounga angustirostris]
MDPEVSLLLQCPPGGLREEQVRAELSPDHDRRPLPGGDEAIAAIWESRLRAQPWLFDAPKFRLHSAILAPTGSQGPQLLLRLGLTSYRDFLGTNWASSASWLQQQGAADWGDKQAYLADPLGVGATLTTADNFLVFLRRSRQVAEAPGLVDVPGGHPEPQAVCPGDSPLHKDLPGELVVHELFSSVLQEICDEGAWVAQMVKRLPSAQVMVPGSWNRVPHRAPCSLGACFSLCLCVSLSLSDFHE